MYTKKVLFAYNRIKKMANCTIHLAYVAITDRFDSFSGLVQKQNKNVHYLSFTMFDQQYCKPRTVG